MESIGEFKKMTYKIIDFPNQDVKYFKNDKALNTTIKQVDRYSSMIDLDLELFKQETNMSVEIKHLGNNEFSVKVDGITYSDLHSRTIMETMSKLNFVRQMIRAYKNMSDQ
jgi:hypothetical protein